MSLGDTTVCATSLPSSEDDVLVTGDGCEVLTEGTPKTVDEVERTCAEAPRLPR